MTADKSLETNGQGARQVTPRKTSRKRVSSRAARVKISRTAASRRTTATGRSAAAKTVGIAARLGIASRALSRGRQAAGDAYEWASEAGGRAMPLASRIADQRLVQRFVGKRPYVLGALGFGIGAIIGLMLPSPLALMAGTHAARARVRSRL